MRSNARHRFHGRRVATVVCVAAAAGLLYAVARSFTFHPGEALIVVAPPVLGAVLWLGWRDVRRFPVRKLVLYLCVLVPVLVAAVAFAADMAGGRVLWTEVFWVTWFVIAWRMAWAVWTRTVGQAGERYRRWGRAARYHAGGLSGIAESRRRRCAALAMLIAPLRASLVVLLFAPLLFGSLIHRIKIGNAEVPPALSDRPFETVRFTTSDGLTISGWFVPEPDSDSTVLICHGAGANKGNFADFVLVFADQGYSSLIFDFRGHGDSDGHTPTLGLLETRDVRAAVDWLKQHRPQYARHVYGIGSSMGAMALVRAAADDPRIEAVVLDSCFISAAALAEQHFGHLPLGRTLITIGLTSMSLHAGHDFRDLDARNAIGRLAPRPVLLIHGEDDVMIPPESLDILYDLANPPKWKWLGPGPHSNVLSTDYYGYRTRVIEFLDAAREKATP